MKDDDVKVVPTAVGNGGSEGDPGEGGEGGTGGTGSGSGGNNNTIVGGANNGRPKPVDPPPAGFPIKK